MTAAPSSDTPREPSRLRALDGLRFVAAAAVVGYHFTGKAIGYWDSVIPAIKFPTLNQVTRYGFIGVEFFFMISGFVILMTAYGRRVGDFTASRFSRLFPAYWVAVLLTAALQAFWDGGRALRPIEVLVNLTMMQEAFDVTNAQGAFWTLWTELKFYLLIGLFMLVGITRNRVIFFAIAWPVLGRLAAATDQALLVSLLIPTYAPYFAVGMLLFLIHRDGGDVLVWAGVGLNLIWCLIHISEYAAKVSGLVRAPVSPVVLCVLVVLMVVAIWAVSSGPLSGLGWKWLTVAGALTYPLYLVHGQFGFAVIDLLQGRMSPYLVLALAVSVALIIAFALHYLVERPLHRPLRRSVAAALDKRPSTIS